MILQIKKLSWSLLLFLAPAISKAQQVTQLSAQQAADLAVKNVVDVRNAQIDYDLQVAKNKEITASAYPQISGTAQINHYLKLPQIQFPNTTDFNIYDILIREGVLKDNGSGAPIKITQNAGGVSVNNVSFFAPWNVQFGVGVQQLLFQPDVLVGLQARSSALVLATENINVAKDKVRDAAYKSYYAVLIAEKQKQFLEDGIKRLKKLISDQEQIFKNGFIEKLDIDKSTVALNNLESGLQQINSGIAINYALLKQALGLPQKDSLRLSELLDEKSIKANLLLADSFNYNDRSEIRSLQAVSQLQKLDLKRNKMGYYPTVAAFVNGGYNGQANPNFKAFTGESWFFYSTVIVGLNVSVPIWDGGQRKQKVNAASLNLQKTNNTIQNVKQLIDMEQSISKNALQSSLVAYDIQQRNVTLAQKVYDTEKKKYEQGLSSAQTLLLSEGEIQTAQSNYFKALYDAIIAKVSYLKAIGKL
jgi:outer membrane protein